ncbi:MAG: hypothetical protein ACPHHQ_11810 [Pseudomonadales bacterium]
MSATFAETVTRDVVEPLKELCELLSEEAAYAEFAWFSAVLTAVIELSKCAFLGFFFSHEAAEKIDGILERAITLSHTMSASSEPTASH